MAIDCHDYHLQDVVRSKATEQGYIKQAPKRDSWWKPESGPLIGSDTYVSSIFMSSNVMSIATRVWRDAGILGRPEGSSKAFPAPLELHT